MLDKVRAFQDAALVMIELMYHKPTCPSANAMKPQVKSLGRPAYSFLQLYHSMTMQPALAQQFEVCLFFVHFFWNSNGRLLFYLLLFYFSYGFVEEHTFEKRSSIQDGNAGCYTTGNR